MIRMRFMEGKRVECYLLPPSAKLDKDRRRVVVMKFAVKLNPNLILACDDKIQRAFEECDMEEREVDNVSLSSTVEHTDIDFYDLPESKNIVYQIRNVTLEGIYIEKSKGTIYLYFVAEMLLAQTPGLDRFVLSRYGTSVFCEFIAAQGALVNPPPDLDEVVREIKRNPAGLIEAAELVRPCVEGGLESITIEIPGKEKLVIDRARAEIIVKAAARMKKSGKG